MTASEGPVPIARGDIQAAVAEIRGASREQLLDPEYLENYLLLRLGLNNESMFAMPKALAPWCGHGVMSWQWPNQFGKYLCHIAQKNISSYMEIGVRRGGTFIITVEYLSRFNSLRRAVALDLHEQPIMRAYAGYRPEIEYILCDSKGEEAKKIITSQKWDLVLVDGDHSRAGFSADYTNVKNNARTIACHDLANDLFPHLKNFWSQAKEILPGDRVFEALEQYREVSEREGKSYLGIGVLDFS